MNANDTIRQVAETLNATLPEDQHELRVFVPSHDRDGVAVDQAAWVERVAETLASAAGGVTVEPSVKGGWLNKETGKMIWEHPVPVFSFLTASALSTALPCIKRTLHQMGAETRQGEVGVEFDGKFLLISKFSDAVTKVAA